jgi:pSer/pThr/pTyr-binding forkhead associated (FHA) protein
MKARLIVIQGKNEGKTIPLAAPVFRIGRSETCHLRPNSERVSREHAEFVSTPEGLVVRDLGSRNGTLVNGRALTGSCALKDHDTVQVGPLIFSVAYGDKVALGSAAECSPHAEFDQEGETSNSWKLTDLPLGHEEVSEHGGDTIMIPAFTDILAADGGDGEDHYERYPDDGETAGDLPSMSALAEPTARRASAGVSPSASEIMRKMMGRRAAVK